MSKRVALLDPRVMCSFFDGLAGEPRGQGDGFVGSARFERRR
jgi:hypothetical protein